MNVTKLRGHAPLSILWMNLVEKISFPVGYVIGLTHHLPLSILQMKAEEVFCLLDKTILPNLSSLHMVTRDSPFHHVGDMQTFFPFSIFSFFISSFLVLSFLAF